MAPAVLAGALLASPALAADVYGIWLTEAKTAHVEVYKCPDAARGPVCGRIVRLLAPKGPDGKPVKAEDAVDFRNPDAKLSTRKLLQMVFLYDFKSTSTANSFEEGAIYSAEDGKSYKANLSLQADGTLRLRGYVGAPILGKTQIWTRVQ
ncbi:MAG: DUF2147 domain-containing protein [Alphaproteobacteria bacterium]|nr:DUF2147 domain-containing protein [Alphaproteobacteria bacterium]